MKPPSIPRPEYPRMQFRRETSWLNLNGPWQFAFDHGMSFAEREVWKQKENYPLSIQVPFPPESELSGIREKDFCDSVWYRREIVIPADWTGKNILLHFGAVDYYAHVYLDNEEVGYHHGGSSSFTIDLTPFAKPGTTQVLVVHALDFTRDPTQPSGKQSSLYRSHGCLYTRVTGIWQTVWMEAVAPCGLQNCVITPDLVNEQVLFRPQLLTPSPERPLRFTATVTLPDGKTAQTSCDICNAASVALPLPSPRLWCPSDPFLYETVLEISDPTGTVIDRVESYFGMRSFDIRGNRFYLNGKPIYLRWILDQGFYPTGIWTAPSDDDLRHDIELSLQLGFNGARLHQKVFEERFHYWADRLGYLTSAEFASWGIDYWERPAQYNCVREWLQIVQRDLNHPSIVLWTPMNETRDVPHAKLFDYRAFIFDLYNLTKALDTTRPFHDASGYSHALTDVWSVHPYEKDGRDLMKFIHPQPGQWRKTYDNECGFHGQPYFVDEWGGFRYLPEMERSATEPGWGYNGLAPKSPAELCALIEDQAKAMAEDNEIAGWCYTQLTDVEQEQNGVYTYGRNEKCPTEMLKKALGWKPAWSEY